MSVGSQEEKGRRPLFPAVTDWDRHVVLRIGTYTLTRHNSTLGNTMDIWGWAPVPVDISKPQAPLPSLTSEATGFCLSLHLFLPAQI